MRVTVDGRPVDMPAGASVLDAARAAGATVSTLCHDDRLAPAGTCRVCLVRAGGAVVAACVTPLTEGMAVQTDDDEVVDDARRVVELMVERLPRSALDRSSELADVCARLEIPPSGFADIGRGLGSDSSHPYIELDRDLCIACGRCVRMCDEVQGTFALTLVGRGADTVVDTGTGGPWLDSACVACGVQF